jgi:hypothetical protein
LDHPLTSPCPTAPDARLPWQAPVLKKGSIGAETSDLSGRRFDAAHLGMS